MGHLNGISARVGGNLNNNFRKSQIPGGLPGGGMLKLRFDRYISKISSNFALHLIKVGKLKRFKKDLADLRFCGFLSFEKGETCQSVLILFGGKIT